MDLMQRRRQLIGMQQVGELPQAYRRVEYIESSGTQYIDTLINLGENDFFVEVDFSITFQSNREQALISIWKQPEKYWNLFVKQSMLIDAYTEGHHYPTTNAMVIGTRHLTTLKREGNEWTATQDDNATTWTYTPGVVNQETVKLFTRGDVPTISYSETHARIYDAKIYISDTLASEFIPCVRKSDNKPGMYDTVTKTFFTNAGTGEFVIPE